MKTIDLPLSLFLLEQVLLFYIHWLFELVHYIISFHLFLEELSSSSLHITERDYFPIYIVKFHSMLHMTSKMSITLFCFTNKFTKFMYWVTQL